MNITIVGTGYVGLVTGTCLAAIGNRVTCLDVDDEKIATLRRGEPTIFEPGLGQMMTRDLEAGRLDFTTDSLAAYRDADIIFICVGTPPAANGSPDLGAVFDVAREIAEAIDELGPDASPKLVVVKSTVPVGTTQRVAHQIRSRTAASFYIANNPEFLKEGAAVNDFMKPDRIVCGVQEEAAGRILRKLYEPFMRQGNPVLVMDIASSEMVKYASNAMLACKISFINEIANLCEHSGADVRAVREGMCSDTRIGNQFLHPGLGYGGSCFPKDTLAVIDMGRTYGYDCKVMSAVHDTNQHQRTYFWNKLLEHFGPSLAGRTLAFWGVAFKPETDDVREAPALTLMEHALEAGAHVRAFDPVASDNLAAVLPDVEIGDDMYSVLDGCDALVICTEWSEFRQPSFDEMSRRMRDKVIFDGRNLYAREDLREEDFTYHSVGRPTVHQRQRGESIRSAVR
jgi:UDPglucose 6-dehydrogenase